MSARFAGSYCDGFAAVTVENPDVPAGNSAAYFVDCHRRAYDHLALILYKINACAHCMADERKTVSVSSFLWPGS